MFSPFLNTRNKGQHYETLALKFLQKQGMTLVKRNYQTRLGEIDLIMQQHTQLIFVEVRFRANARYGSGADTIRKNKQRNIIATAKHYLQINKLTEKTSSRFDVISINQDQTIRWIPAAFTGATT